MINTVQSTVGACGDLTKYPSLEPGVVEMRAA